VKSKKFADSQKLMFRVVFLLLAATTIFGLGACSGGGGGSGGSDKGVRILHGSIDSAPVDLVSSSAEEGVVQTARFGLATQYVRLPEEEQVLHLFRTKSGSAPMFSQTVTIGKEDRLSLLVYGSNEQTGVFTSLLTDTPPEELESGNAALQIIHSAVGASAINVLIGRTEAASGVPFGTSSGYLVVPSGAVQISVRRAADGDTIISPTHTLEDRKNYTILIAGQVDYFVTAPLFEG